MNRYLAADQVHLPTFIKFSPEGHCDWCGKELTGRAKRFCPGDGSRIGWHGYPISLCALYFGNWWYSMPAYKRAVLIRDNFTCQKCGHHQMQAERPWLPETKDLACDHIIPLSKGGETVINNLQILCEPCNRKKGAKLEGEEGEPIKQYRSGFNPDLGLCQVCAFHGEKGCRFGVLPPMRQLGCLTFERVGSGARSIGKDSAGSSDGYVD